MLLDYLTHNYITLMIMLSMTVNIFINRKNERIPGTRYLGAAVVLLLLLTVVDAFEIWLADPAFSAGLNVSPDTAPRVRMIMAALAYILRPLVIMIEVLVTAPGKKIRFFSTIPGILNALIYSTAFFGSHIAFHIDPSNHWHMGPLGLTIYFTLMFYVFMLALFSIIYFRWDNVKRSAILFVIVIQAIVSAVFEYTDILIGTVNPVMALGIMEYYFYLAANHRHEMREMIAERELYITKQRIDLLRSQIQPHFIFNSLSIIRSLTKQDTQKAVNCIDSFSDYLKAHIYTIRDDTLIPFDDELYNVRAYLELVQADTRRNISVEYDLQYTDFMLPPLSLEPIVENAIKHGIGSKGGTVRIEALRDDPDIVINISDDGTPQGGLTDQEEKRLGVGLDNTKKRLKLQCDGTLDMNLTDHGAVVTIRIPNN